MTVNSEGTSRKSLKRTGKVELLEFFCAEARQRRPGSWNGVFRRPGIGAGSEECAAERDAVVASARLVVGKVRTALN